MFPDLLRNPSHEDGGGTTALSFRKACLEYNGARTHGRKRVQKVHRISFAAAAATAPRHSVGISDWISQSGLKVIGEQRYEVRIILSSAQCSNEASPYNVFIRC